MFQYLFEQLLNYAPQIGIYIGVIILTTIVVWNLAGFYIRTNKMSDKLSDIEVWLMKISAGLSTLSHVLVEKSVISQSCYSHENSPRTVNELGKKLYKESGAETLFETIKTDLMQALEKKKFDSLLELERSCLDVMLERMNDPAFKQIQNFAFRHPSFEKMPLTYTDILFVMALMLREEYRQRYVDKLLD